MNSQRLKTTSLDDRQKAGSEVEEKILKYIIGMDSTGSLTLSDVKEIAGAARNIAFDAFNSKGVDCG